MNWTELFAQAADSADRARLLQLVLDCALAAVDAARSTVLDAAITAQTPTTLGLCALLDAHGVRAPVEVVARVCWYAKPSAANVEQPVSVQQDLPIGRQPAFWSFTH